MVIEGPSVSRADDTASADNEYKDTQQAALADPHHPLHALAIAECMFGVLSGMIESLLGDNDATLATIKKQNATIRGYSYRIDNWIDWAASLEGETEE